LHCILLYLGIGKNAIFILAPLFLAKQQPNHFTRWVMLPSSLEFGYFLQNIPPADGPALSAGRQAAEIWPVGELMADGLAVVGGKRRGGGDTHGGSCLVFHFGG
jgi:hypothetical protein